MTTRPRGGRKRGKPVAVVKHGSAVVPVYQGSVRGITRFTIAYYRDGLRERRTFGSLEAAKEEARLAALNIQRGLACDNNLRPHEREDYRIARSILEPLGVSLLTAINEYTKCRHKLVDVPLLTATDDYLRRVRGFTAGIKVAQVSEEFIAVKARDGISKRYLELIQQTLKHFGKWFAGAIDEISTQQLDRWVRRGEHSVVTRNKWVGLLKEFFGFARRQGYLPRSEPTVAEDLKIGRRGDTDVEIFTPEIMEKMLRAATSETLPILGIGGFAGLRPAEIERLDWGAVDLNRKMIELRAGQAKTSSRRIVPVSDNLLAWLAHLPRKGPVILSHEIFRKARRLAEGAGIEWPHNALRHSYISYRLAIVQNAAQVALEAGNSPTIIFKHYRELVTKEQAEKWFAIMPA